MRNIRWQLLIAIGGFVLVVGLLLGQTPSAEDVVPQPATGGVYSEALVGSIQRLNPILDDLNQVDKDIDRLLYAGLIQYNQAGLPTPSLAESWSVSADATFYTFSLRHDAHWHDGEPVTADDVIYTFSKLQDPGYSGPADLHEFWKEITIVRLDDHTVQFQLPEPYAPFLDFLTVGLLPDHLLRGVTVSELVNHPFHLQPIGTGPFRFEDFVLEDGQVAGVTLVRFDDYFGDLPFLERIEFHTYPTPEDALGAYRLGETQGIGEITPAILHQALEDPQLNVYTVRVPTMGIVFLNTQNTERPFLAEKEVRQALLLATNRQWFIDHVLDGQGMVAVGPVLPGTWAFSEGLEPVPFDAMAAVELLDNADWKLPVGAEPGAEEYVRAKGDTALEIVLTYSKGTPYEGLAQLLAKSWQDIGVRVTLNPVDPEELLGDYLEPRDFEAVLTELNLTDYPDPDPYPFWHDSQVETGQNYSGFTDRNMSIWLERARTSFDYDERAKLYRSFQHRFQDQLPSLFLYCRTFSYGVQSRVRGITLGPLFDASNRFAYVSEWHLLSKRTGEPTPTSVQSSP